MSKGTRPGPWLCNPTPNNVMGVWDMNTIIARVQSSAGLLWQTDTFSTAGTGPFILTHVPQNNSLMVFRNTGLEANWTLALVLHVGAQVTLAVALDGANDVLTCRYQYIVGT